MSNISGSFLNEKRVNLIAKICGEHQAKELQNNFKSAFDNVLIDIDEKTSTLINFIAKIDNINTLDDKNKTTYTVGSKKVHVINKQKDLDFAVKKILKSRVLGFDTEQKPIFKKGVKPSKISIIQLSDNTDCYIFQIQQIRNIKPLLSILTNSDIAKVGIGLRGDSKALLDEFNITLKCCIDFGLLFKSKLYHENEIGAKKSVLLFLDKKLQKSGRASRSNWEIGILSDSQIKYASEDAACVHDVFCTMLINYPFLVEILPEWFRNKYNDKYYDNLLMEFKSSI